MQRVIRGRVAAELSRRDFLQRTSALGAAALVASALPVAERVMAEVAYAADPTLDDATLQAFADTIIPGRKATKTDLGDPIHPPAGFRAGRTPPVRVGDRVVPKLAKPKKRR